jgi:putative glutamine amidotransferase
MAVCHQTCGVDRIGQQAMNRPTIGITTGSAPLSPDYLLLWLAVRGAGGDPVRLRVRRGWPYRHRPARHVTDRFTAGRGVTNPDRPLHGVLISGGKGITGSLPGPLDDAPDSGPSWRDVFECDIAQRARAEGVPVLGICRGAQVLSVAGHGSLHSSVREAYRNARYPHHPLGYALFRKRIRILPDTLIAKLTRCERLHVNSLHRQAIDRLGAGLHATAVEENGVVQAIEDPEHPFYLGVQFHPELLYHRRPFRRIFVGLVAEARKAAARRAAERAAQRAGAPSVAIANRSR